MRFGSIGARPLLVAVLATYAAMAIISIGVTPYRTPGHLLSRMQDLPQIDIGAPDELQHSEYVRHIASGKGFPTFDQKSPDFAKTYQAHQPPLHYVLASPLSALCGGNDNAEKWLLRGFSLLLGMTALVFLYYAVAFATGNNKIAVFATAITAFLPAFIALTSSVTNDAMLLCLSCLLLLVCTKGVVHGFSSRLLVGLGVLLGLLLLTKTSALLLIPMAVAAVWMAPKVAWSRLLSVCAPLLLGLLVASPWLMRNQSLYGDPLAIGAFRQASVGNLDASVAIAELGGATYWLTWVGANLLRSFWGVFGYFDIYLADSVYAILTLSAVAMGLGVVLRRGPDSESILLRLSGIAFAGVLLGFAAYNASYYQAQARYVYPAVYFFSIAIAIGLWRLCKGSTKTFAAVGASWVVGAIALELYVLLVLLPRSFELATK